MQEVLADITVQTVLESLVVLGLAYAAASVGAYLLEYYADRFGKWRINIKMAAPILKMAVYGAALYYIVIQALELGPGQFVAVAGLIGIGIGFGLRDAFASVFGGLILALERPYRVGDTISLEGEYGEVTDIGIRSTKMVTPLGNTVVVPNKVLIEEAISNSNAGEIEMMTAIDLYIDPGSDFDLAMRILRDAVITSRYVYISEGHPVTVFLNDFPFYRRLRARAYVSDMRYEFIFKSEITVRAWREFARNGIEPPRADVVNIGRKPWPGDAGTQERQELNSGSSGSKFGAKDDI